MSGKKIVIIDYGMGNIQSIANALSFLGYKAILSRDHAVLDQADGYILPGVGAFGVAMENLYKYDLITVLEKNVLTCKKPLLGICLGMQLLAKSSTEMGFHKGLGWVDATIEELIATPTLRVPHVGWNSIEVLQENPLFKAIPSDTHFYFDHSFYMKCHDKTLQSSVTLYGELVTASLQKENIFATQFHPEKSQTAGLKLLRNFLNFVEDAHA